MNVKTIKEFFKKDIWYRDYGDKPFYIRFAVGMMRMLYLAIEGFTTKRMISSSAALTNSTLLAIVPIIAVVFAIARASATMRTSRKASAIILKASHR